MKKIAIAVLVILVGGAGYFRVTDSKDVQKEIDRNPQLSPHATYRTQGPNPTIAVEQIRIEREYLQQVAAAENKKMDNYHITVMARHAYHRYPGLN